MFGELATAWPSMLVGGGVLGAPLAGFTAWLAHKRATRKQTDDVSIEIVREMKALRTLDVQRISALEAQAESERRACAAEIAEVRQSLRAAEAEGRLRESRLVHRVKNAESDLKALIWVAEYGPDRLQEAIERHQREQAEREHEDA
jgi:hypothetical protein